MCARSKLFIGRPWMLPPEVAQSINQICHSFPSPWLYYPMKSLRISICRLGYKDTVIVDYSKASWKLVRLCMQTMATSCHMDKAISEYQLHRNRIATSVILAMTTAWCIPCFSGPRFISLVLVETSGFQGNLGCNAFIVYTIISFLTFREYIQKNPCIPKSHLKQ